MLLVLFRYRHFLACTGVVAVVSHSCYLWCLCCSILDTFEAKLFSADINRRLFNIIKRLLLNEAAVEEYVFRYAQVSALVPVVASSRKFILEKDRWKSERSQETIKALFYWMLYLVESFLSLCHFVRITVLISDMVAAGFLGYLLTLFGSPFLSRYMTALCHISKSSESTLVATAKASKDVVWNTPVILIKNPLCALFTLSLISRYERGHIVGLYKTEMVNSVV